MADGYLLSATSRRSATILWKLKKKKLLPGVVIVISYVMFVTGLSFTAETVASMFLGRIYTRYWNIAVRI